jgi:MYXO-CTERM domain-containing protein
MLLMILGMVHAGEIEAWSIDDFGQDNYMAGEDGWSAGYEDDPWYAYEGQAYSLTDDGDGTESYGEGGAADNWLIRGEAIQQVSVRAEWSSQDDDTVGIVSNHNGSNSFYLLAYTENSAPPPLQTVNNGAALILMRVEKGEPEVLERVRSDFATNTNEFTLEVDDGVITVSLNGDTSFSVEDPDPLGAGKVGMYAYNSGQDQGGNVTYCWFSAMEVSYVDEDDDGVADDEDNCEDVSNPGQADWNDNGIGDACGDPPPQDEDTGEPQGGDTGGPGDTDLPPGVIGGNVELEVIGCGCSSSPKRSGLPMVALLGLAALLRRRRQ